MIIVNYILFNAAVRGAHFRTKFLSLSLSAALNIVLILISAKVELEVKIKVVERQKSCLRRRVLRVLANSDHDQAKN